MMMKFRSGLRVVPDVKPRFSGVGEVHYIGKSEVLPPP